MTVVSFAEMRSQYFYVQPSPDGKGPGSSFLTDELWKSVSAPPSFLVAPSSTITPFLQQVGSALSDLLKAPVSIVVSTEAAVDDFHPVTAMKLMEPAGSGSVSLFLDETGRDLIGRQFLQTISGSGNVPKTPHTESAAVELLALETLELYSTRYRNVPLQLECTPSTLLVPPAAGIPLVIKGLQKEIRAQVIVSGFVPTNTARPVAADNATPGLQLAFPPLRLPRDLLEALQVGDLLRSGVASLLDPDQFHLLTTNGWSIGMCRNIATLSELLRFHVDEVELQPAHGFDPSEIDIVRPCIGRVTQDQLRAAKTTAGTSLDMPYSPHLVVLWCQGQVAATGKLCTHDAELAIEITNPFGAV